MADVASIIFLLDGARLVDKGKFSSARTARLWQAGRRRRVWDRGHRSHYFFGFHPRA
ncbi:unnamed protein product [Gulo gulo]|uniref:Uncharacterized protein n=1 Tax=Gulo gulo TaxID=48420 RepID=A0A9X9MD51_GULGU|nr:unnamed protein product [Gulo gulo]